MAEKAQCMTLARMPTACPLHQALGLSEAEKAQCITLARMPTACPLRQASGLSEAEKALCMLAHRGPRPRPVLQPLDLELWLYVQKTHSMQKKRMEASCLELALEGERLCKGGDFKGGTAFFEAAVQVGTEDLKTLSAIYSQLGNAYFYLKEYAKALEYHRHDLTLARTIGDRVGEGKASGNLGNTLKVLGRYDEAAVCSQRHLDIARELQDKVGEARALYNSGNVFHAKGKQQSWNFSQDPGDLPPDVRETLQKATDFYEMNLSLVKELGDRAAQGRVFGNLGNTHYLLGNFVEAINFHKERLSIAKEFGDKAAERRAYSNLGNAHIFLGQFSIATEYYRKTLHLSRQLKDQVMEAQACYSLGNTFTLLQEYERAIEYHLKHLLIAQELGDRVGEGRACWSLGNAYVSLGNHRQALHFASKHLETSREIGDCNGELTARMNVEQLMTALGMGEDLSPCGSEFEAQGARPKFVKRNSMDSLDLWKYSSEKDQNGDSHQMNESQARARSHLSGPIRSERDTQSGAESRWLDCRASPVDTNDIRVQVVQSKISRHSSDEECFFDLLSKFQSNRMDDQRCPLDEQQNGVEGASSTHASALDNRIAASSLMTSPQTEEFFDLIASSQSRRLDDQRASINNLPGLRITQNNLGHLCADPDPQEPSDDFFNMLMKCQASRIDDQRCSPPDPGPRAPTVPDEDFFSLIQRVQAKRLDEQRVHLSSDDQDETQEQPPSPPPS
ncbi:G-protein-signaling modulator 1b isoform X5 [Acipenser oxyrinchus oxyrinchus]|uniref:G-protein-signaling modulator 1b isoform X5 n=1 Tax=Acipenser oxyrinchus oxyrinchus TaxID=40147 RepID=A0AAD8CUR6_ACIOX|nr:G-protein-signaling modulator 1b isoform X5 [Acipenser oxyrinchus oxyrinchus]